MVKRSQEEVGRPFLRHGEPKDGTTDEFILARIQSRCVRSYSGFGGELGAEPAADACGHYFYVGVAEFFGTASGVGSFSAKRVGTVEDYAG